MTRRSAAAFVCLALCACSDPVHDAAVDALGPEQAGIRPGPDHRPGQPCLTCHGGDGPADFTMSFGGTLYVHVTGDAPLPHATVHVVDVNGRSFDTRTNCAGNFWIPAHRFAPTFPVQAGVIAPQFSRTMMSKMHLDGSCNACHSASPGDNSAGRIWVYPPSGDPPAAKCVEPGEP